MNIHEKTIIRHSFQFTQEDLDLITRILQENWRFATTHTLINHYDRAFARTLMMLDRVRDSVMYRSDMTCEDDEHLDTLRDALCTFICKHEDEEDNPDIDRVREMFSQILAIRKAGGDY